MMLHRARFEGNRQRFAVGPVALEIHQHQPARKKIVQHRSPALLAGEDLVPVEHHQFGRIGSEQHHILLAETIGAIDRAKAFEHILAKADRVLDHLQRRADNRQSLFARNMRQLLFAGRFHPLRVGAFLIGITMRFCCDCGQRKSPEAPFCCTLATFMNVSKMLHS